MLYSSWESGWTVGASCMITSSGAITLCRWRQFVISNLDFCVWTTFLLSIVRANSSDSASGRSSCISSSAEGSRKSPGEIDSAILRWVFWSSSRFNSSTDCNWYSSFCSSFFLPVCLRPYGIFSAASISYSSGSALKSPSSILKDVEDFIEDLIP